MATRRIYFKSKALNEILKHERPTSSRVAVMREDVEDDKGNIMQKWSSIFVATDSATGAPRRTRKSGDLIFNVKPQPQAPNDLIVDDDGESFTEAWKE